MQSRYFAVAAACAGLLLSGAAFSQIYPAKPVRAIVPIAVGGPPDVAARIVLARVAEGLGQPVVVENRPGAGGTLGSGVAAKSAPDGYTLLVGSVTSLALGPAMFRSAGIDPVKMFAPISLFNSAPSVIVVGAEVPARTLQEFIALAKSKPGTYNIGAPTLASPPAISGAEFANLAGIKLVAVPFSDPAGVINAILRGEAHLNIESLGSLGPHIKAGRLRVLAVADNKRHPLMPDLPTAAEAGLPGFTSGTWSGLLAPSGTPAALIQRLNSEVRVAVGARDVQAVFERQGGEARWTTPQEFASLIASEAAKWARSIEIAGLKPE